jgi:hypothetical protein
MTDLTREAAREALRSNVCPFCGRYFRALGTHSAKAHGVTATDLREAAGWTRMSTSSPDLTEHYKRVRPDVFAAMDPDKRERLLENLRLPKKKSTLSDAARAWIRERGSLTKGQVYGRRAALPSEPPVDLPHQVKHGTRNAYNYYGCRCDPCRDVNAATKREADLVRRQKLAARADMPHGSTSTYDNWGCRCDLCFAAKSKVNAVTQRRRISQVDT